MALRPRTRLTLFGVLGGLALLALAGAGLTVALAPARPGIWLGLSLGLLGVVVFAEVALLVYDRVEKA